MAGSLASATSSRVDSASKHIVPCKVNTDFLISTMHDSNVHGATRELQIHKMKYCMHKDDLVIGLGRALGTVSVYNYQKKAYPTVFTTNVGWGKDVRKFLALVNCHVQAPEDLKYILDQATEQSNDSKFKHDGRKNAMKIVHNMLECHFVGVSLGLAYAHGDSGDTVASVMVGGLKTVLNGRFQVNTE
jgi:hypothetical protein